MLTQTLERDEAALLVEQLFDYHSDAIFTYLLRLTRSREVAEELAQETFLRAFEARARLEGVANQRAWLYRIATNLAFNHFRRQRRFAWLPWGEADDAHIAAEDVAERAGQADAIERALDALSLDYRAALLLCCYHDLKMTEAASALAISEGALKMRLRRAREAFRRAYQPDEQGGGLP